MVTRLHIERQDKDGARQAIPLAQWTEAVEALDGIRMAEGNASATNPRTGDAIVMPNRGGDAEVYRPDCKRWMRSFWWSPQGMISFPAPEHRADPVMSLARVLAEALDARIIDDDGQLQP